MHAEGAVDGAEAVQQEETYELAVMRAELLGLTPPDRASYEAARSRRQANVEEEEEAAERAQVESEAYQAEALQEGVRQNEELKGVTGGLEELTNILSITQHKLNRFKTVCGSIKNLFKLQGEATEGASGADDATGASSSAAADGAEHEKPSMDQSRGLDGAKGAAMDMHSNLNSQVDKLDALLMKAENAQASMQHQNKQMRSLLR